MLVAIVAVAVILAPQASPDPASLVDQLGSSRYAVRVSAESELIRLGRTALPSLQAARLSKDAEIRSRSVALVAKIENSLLLQLTPVAFDFKETPLPEAIEVLSRQAGSTLALAPEDRHLLAARRVNARSARPLPFWGAIDALCSAANIHPVLGDQPSKAALEGTLLFADGPMADFGPLSDSGAFRVTLASIHYQSEIRLDQPRNAPTGRAGEAESSLDASRPPSRATREFFLQLALAAEPRLSVTRNGAIKLVEAIDDRGRSLLGPPGPGSFQHTAGYHGMNPSSMLRFRVDLEYPETRSSTIKTLRGSIPVMVATRKPDPLLVPLAESRGKLFRNDDVALTVIDHRPASANMPATVQLAIRTGGSTVEPARFGAGAPWDIVPTRSSSRSRSSTPRDGRCPGSHRVPFSTGKRPA